MKLNQLLPMLFVFLLMACSNQEVKTQDNTKEIVSEYKGEKVSKSPAEWREILTPDEYYVLREKGTERAFTGEYYDHKGDGVYVCRGCGLELFDSSSKFKSGTGWPSYFEAINDTNVGELADNSYGWNRVEIVCNRCNGHLGHVFNDGPQPTGLRYCVNSASLEFVSREKMK